MTTASSVPVFGNVSIFISAFLDPRARALSGVTESRSLDELFAKTPWKLADGEIKNGSKPFFSITAVESCPGGREVPGWLQPVIADEMQGLIVLFHDPAEQTFLVRAKAEPGNVGFIVQDTEERLRELEQDKRGTMIHDEHERRGLRTTVLLSSPFQASKANMAAHGGNIPLIGIVRRLADEGKIVWELRPEDGARFLEKVNLEACVAVTPELRAEIETEILGGGNASDFCWVTRDVLRYLRRQGLANSYLVRASGTAIF